MYAFREQTSSSQYSLFSSSRPSLPPAIVGLILFASTAIYLCLRQKRSATKVPRYLHLVVMAATFETVGYILRIVNHFDTTSTTKLIVMNVFLLPGPNLLALTNYNAIGKVILLCNVSGEPFYLRSNFVFYFFIACHIIAVMLQMNGVVVSASAATNLKKLSVGRSLSLAGLSVQLFFFVCFAMVVFYVYRSPKYDYTVSSKVDAKSKATISLFTTTVLLGVRLIYYIAAIALASTSDVAKAEWAFYVFDALMVLLSLAVYCILYPGDYIPQDGVVSAPIDESSGNALKTIDIGDGVNDTVFEMGNRI